jgi:hypothetical protein
MGGGLAVSDRRYSLAARKQRSVREPAKAETAQILTPVPAKLEAGN